MHDRHVPRQPGREQTVVVAADDAIERELAHGIVDDEPLDGTVRQSRRYLPPPIRRPDRDRQEHSHDPESKLARRAKLIALLLATALLLVSVYIAASLSDSEERGGKAETDRPTITGAAALGGFALSADRYAQPEVQTRRDPSVQAAGPQERAAEAATAEGSPAAGTAPSTDDGGTDATAQATSTTPAAKADKLEAVRDFYDLAASEPAKALRLLGPALAGKQDDHLLRAWRSMKSIRLDDVRHDSDGTVRAVVTMVPAEGKPLRLTQRLRFTTGPRILINEATLVSVKAE